MKVRHSLFLLLILSIYASLYVATSRYTPCEGDCEKVNEVSSKIRNNRQAYIHYLQRCSNRPISDTLCLYVKDTTGINWNLIADSTCYFATQAGLAQQKLFIIKFSATAGTPDTLVQQQCP